MLRALVPALLLISCRSFAASINYSCVVALSDPVPVQGLHILSSRKPMYNSAALIAIENRSRILHVRETGINEIKLIENIQLGSGLYAQELPIYQPPPDTVIVEARYSEDSNVVVLYTVNRTKWWYQKVRNSIITIRFDGDAASVDEPIDLTLKEMVAGRNLFPSAPLEEVLATILRLTKLLDESTEQAESTKPSIFLGLRKQGSILTVYFLKSRDDLNPRPSDLPIQYLVITKIDLSRPDTVRILAATVAGQFAKSFLAVSPQSDRDLFLLRTITDVDRFKTGGPSVRGSRELVRVRFSEMEPKSYPLPY